MRWLLLTQWLFVVPWGADALPWTSKPRFQRGSSPLVKVSIGEGTFEWKALLENADSPRRGTGIGVKGVTGSDAIVAQ